MLVWGYTAAMLFTMSKSAALVVVEEIVDDDMHILRELGVAVDGKFCKRIAPCDPID
jgi:hypothetical protein